MEEKEISTGLDYDFKIEISEYAKEIPLEEESLDYDFKVEIPEDSPTQPNTGKKVQGKWLAATSSVCWKQKIKSETCTKCEAVFQSRRELLRHMRSSHKIWFICKDCNKRFKSETDLGDHAYRMHLKIKRKCEHCDFEAYKEESMTRHFSQKHSPDKFKCQTCEKTFKTETQLHWHDRKNHVVLKYPCLECDYIGSQRTYLKLHINNIHQRDKRTLYDCHLCERKFTEKYAVKKHIKKYTRIHERGECR